MVLGTPPSRPVLALGAALATLVAGGAAWATPRLWAAGRPGWAMLLAASALFAFKGLLDHWPGFRERRVLRAARREANRLLAELDRILRRGDGGDDRPLVEATREGLARALDSGDGGLLGAKVAEAGVLARRHARPLGARRIALFVALALAAVIALRLFVVGAFRVASVSMAPTLLVGDVLLVDRTAYAFGALPERGDVVVWQTPADRRDYVKRVVGLPGDELFFDGRTFTINGEPLRLELVGEVDLDEDGGVRERQRFLLGSELWTESSAGAAWSVVRHKSVNPRPAGTWQVAPGHLFVVGDNRDDSIDSRSDEVGLVPIEHVQGRALRILFSTGRAGGRWDRLLAKVE